MPYSRADVDRYRSFEKLRRRRRRQLWSVGTAILVLAFMGLALTTKRLTGDHVGLVAAAGSLVAAVASWAATSRAGDTADAVAAIERDRWHVELTPTIEVSINYANPSGPQAMMRIALVGPAALESLESVFVEVRDDELERPPAANPPPTADDIATQVWGPLRFAPGIDEVREDGRRTPSFRLAVGGAKRFVMEATRPPFWHNHEHAQLHWVVEQANKPVRLRIVCYAEGHRPWFLHQEVLPARPEI